MRELLLIALLCGCAAHTAEAPLPREAETAAPAPSPAPPPPAASTAPGTISRGELLQVLDRSPGAFLQHVDVAPRFRGGRFEGWRIQRFFPGDDRFSGVDVQAGDVVTSVNGLPIEKPEQLMVVWQALRTAAALEVTVERNGEPRTLRWPIRD